MLPPTRTTIARLRLLWLLIAPMAAACATTNAAPTPLEQIENIRGLVQEVDSAATALQQQAATTDTVYEQLVSRNFSGSAADAMALVKEEQAATVELHQELADATRRAQAAVERLFGDADNLVSRLREAGAPVTSEAMATTSAAAPAEAGQVEATPPSPPLAPACANELADLLTDLQEQKQAAAARWLRASTDLSACSQRYLDALALTCDTLDHTLSLEGLKRVATQKPMRDICSALPAAVATLLGTGKQFDDLLRPLEIN